MEIQKEQYELEELKINIEKKRLEIQKEEIEIKWEMAKIVELENDRANNKARTLIDKISELRSLLSDVVIDEDQTILLGEPKYRRLAQGRIEILATRKLAELISKF
ncbi:MAG: hypothetical protein R2730_03815 [Chitinophagales bacterium]